MKRFLAMVLGASACAAAFAADKAVEDLLAQMRTAYRSAKSVKLVAEGFVPSNEGRLKASFELIYRSPNLFRADVTFGKTAKSRVTCDGRQIQLKSGRNQRQIPYSLDSASFSVPGNLETICFWDWQRQLSTGDKGNMKGNGLKVVESEAWAGRNWMVLEETAPKQNLFVRYFIDPKTKFIWRTVVTHLKSKELLQDAVVKKLELGVKADPSLFVILTGLEV